MAANISATVSPPHIPSPYGNATPRRIPTPIEPRDRASNGELISLAEPIPGEEGRSLADVLAARATQMQAQEHPKTRAVSAACTVILMLDQRDETSAADPQTCQRAADVLLNLGQARLLQRLAAVTGQTFQLNLGASACCADVLLRIDRPWPQGVPLSLQLDTRMPPLKVKALQAFFLKFPSELNVYVHAQTDAPMPGLAEALAGTLKARPLEALTLACGASSVGVVRAMADVSAQAICVRAERTPAEAPQPVIELHDALTELVRLSGAKRLSVAGGSSLGVLSEDLVLKMLNCQQDWSLLQLAPFAGEGKVLQWLAAGRHKIGRLEVFGWTAARSLRDLLQAAEKNQVHTLVFDPDVDVIRLAECLDFPLQTSRHVFERIEARLTYLPGEHARARLALDSILGNPVVVCVRHLGGRAGEGLMSIDDLDAIRLNQAGASGRLMPLQQRLAQLPQTAQRRASALIQALAAFLHEQCSVGTLLSYLQRPTTSLLPALPQLVSSGRAGSAPLVQKLGPLLDCIEHQPFIRGAIAVHLRDHPDALPSMCAALSSVNFPKRALSGEQWKGMGRRYALSQPGAASAASAAIARPGNALAIEKVMNSLAVHEYGPSQRMIDGVQSMLRARMPKTLIILALLTGLEGCRAGEAAYVEALVYVDVIPHEVWLREGLGIEVRG